MEDLSSWQLLQKIDSPKDLKALSDKEALALAEEIRAYLVERVTQNGGHLASNLGVVELTMAIHRVFDTPRDHVIFDVGHQSYVHKLLTGRKEAFDTLREPGGISGFTKREESEYDAFGAGHSSTSISAGVGMAEAERLKGSDAYTVVVVGDGALTSGLCYEGLNNCRRNLKLVIVINENEMSISRNKGRLSDHLSHLRSSRRYLRTKEFTSSALRHIPLLGKPIYTVLRSIKRRIRRLFCGENFFEHLGVRYLGPIDGNDLKGVTASLEHAKHLGCSVILHVKTKKGKGYPPAEKEPWKFHGLTRAGEAHEGETFSSVFGQTLSALAAEREHLCAITAAMSEGTGLVPFAAAHPKRFFDVGIAEGHAVTFAAGLSAAGLLPVVAVYSTFFQRSYDNILHDVALQHLPVIFCVDRAGLSLRDGVTHHGIYDVAMFSQVKDLPILAPVTFAGLRAALREAVTAGQAAMIRYPSGTESALLKRTFGFGEQEEPARVRVWENGLPPSVCVVSYGRITEQAILAAQELAACGVGVRVLLCEYLAPYGRLAAELSPHLTDRVVFLEEGVRTGGFAEHLSQTLLQSGNTFAQHILAIEDPTRATQTKNGFTAEHNIDKEAVLRAVKQLQNEVLE